MVEIFTPGFPPSVPSSENLILRSRKAPSTALRSCRVLAVMPIDEDATPSSIHSWTWAATNSDSSPEVVKDWIVGTGPWNEERYPIWDSVSPSRSSTSSPVRIPSVQPRISCDVL